MSTVLTRPTRETLTAEDYARIQQQEIEAHNRGMERVFQNRSRSSTYSLVGALLGIVVVHFSGNPGQFGYLLGSLAGGLAGRLYAGMTESDRT